VNNKTGRLEEENEGDHHSSPEDTSYSQSRDYNVIKQRALLIENSKDDGESSASSLSTAAELHINDNKILSLLKGSSESSYTFNGLVRELNMHQQSLSRSLKRLTDLGLVEHIKNYGFRLTSLGQRLGFTAVSPNNSKNLGRRHTQLAQLHMHFTKLNILRIASKLTGRWFEGFRWVGKTEDPAFSVLMWKKHDNSFGIKVIIMQGSLIIESDAVSEKEIVEAVKVMPKIVEMVTQCIDEKFISQYRSEANLALSRVYPCVNKALHN
jgi:predicted transcriptional regulator